MGLEASNWGGGGVSSPAMEVDQHRVGRGKMRKTTTREEEIERIILLWYHVREMGQDNDFITLVIYIQPKHYTKPIIN